MITPATHPGEPAPIGKRKRQFIPPVKAGIARNSKKQQEINNGYSFRRQI
jgi:hypothetical protein